MRQPFDRRVAIIDLDQRVNKRVLQETVGRFFQVGKQYAHRLGIAQASQRRGGLAAHGRLVLRNQVQQDR